MTDHSRTRDAEVAALLAELEDAGGRVKDTNSRVPSASTRGTVGSANVLDEQIHQIGSRRVSMSGSTSRRARQTASASSGAPSSPSTSGMGAAFSTYAPLPEVSSVSEGRSPASLGVRLAPLQPLGTADSGGSGVGFKPSPPPPRGSGSAPAGQPAALTAFRPLPDLSGGRVGASLAQKQAPKEEIGIHDHKKFVEQEARQKDSGKVAANAHPTHRPDSGTPAQASGKATTSANNNNDNNNNATSSSDGEVYRETNFLPLMCSRYLRPAGLTPGGRWGHTLTAVDETHLFAFGGVELSGDESNLLCEFNVSSIAWEPAFVNKGTPPSPRQGHAACACEGRYLIIYGGLSSKGTKLLNDMHMYDAYTQSWSCIWDGRQYNKHEPSARFGHSMVICDDRLYVYGGRTLKPNGKDGTTLANADVFVFSLNSRRWKHRITASRTQKSKAASTETTTTTTTTTTAPHTANKDNDGADKDDDDDDGVIVMSGPARDKAKSDKFQSAGPVNPVPRSHHAACVLGDMMYIHGGAGGGAAVLTDTWCMHLPSGVWSCLHTGLGSDAVPREKHALFACGEALLLVGGCTGGKGIADRIATKFNNFVAVLPLTGQEVPCWVPVSMGNASIVAPSRKAFGAAFHGGFVYLFGGVSGAEPATNSMVRFLAADGYVAADARATASANDEALRGMMQKLRERVVVPCDLYATAATLGAVVSHANCVGFHRALLQQRAPLLLQKLLACRSEPWGVTSHGGSGGGGTGAGGTGGTGGTGGAAAVGGAAAALLARRRSSTAAGESAAAEAQKDVVDALMQQLNPDTSPSVSGGGGGGGGGGGEASSGGARPQLYYTLGNSRVQGLDPALTGEELAALADYLAWGGLKSEFRLLLEEVEDRAEAKLAGAEEANDEAEKLESGMGPQRERLTNTLKGLQKAAAAFQLAPLGQLCDALLAGSRKKLNVARQACAAALRHDLVAMSESAAGATMTVLFADPHTRHQTAQSLHPAILMSSSGFFADLLRPLYTGEKTSFQIGAIAAKSTLPAAPTPSAAVNQLLTTTSKRAILVGPISVPTRAIQPLVRFLYSQQLRVGREAALDTMLGAHELGLSELQAFSESIVAREEVNFETCCAFYYLARKYNAALLEEMCLLTAVAGYAEVRHSGGYLGLSVEDRQSIDAVATELRSNSWVGAPAAVAELKTAEAYAARWNVSAPPS